MSERGTERTHEFVAYDNSDHPWTIQRWEDFTVGHTRGGGSSKNVYQIRYQTPSGDSVNRIKKGEYEIVGFARVITDNDPLEP